MGVNVDQGNEVPVVDSTQEVEAPIQGPRDRPPVVDSTQEVEAPIQGPRERPSMPPRPNQKGRSRRRRSNSRNTSSRAMFLTRDGVVMPSTEDIGGDGFIWVMRPGGRKRINGWRSFGMGNQNSGVNAGGGRNLLTSGPP